MKSTQILSSPFLGGLPPWLAHPVGVLLVMLLVLTSSALGAEEGDFLFEPEGVVGARVTGYRGSGGAVAIPERLGGLPVTSIGNHAFSHQARLTNVTIPNRVTSIEGGAFAGCTGLTELYFQGQSPGLSYGTPIFDSVGRTTGY